MKKKLYFKKGDSDMLKIPDMIISAILKKGILYETRNCELEFEIPTTQVGADGENQEHKMKIQIKAEHMSLKIEKD